MIRWLHISDLHMKLENDADQDNFCNALLEDCYASRINVDFVVATGDFHNVWDAQYNASCTFLHKLMEALDLDIEKDLFMIPGNHDTDMGEHAESVKKFLSLVKSDAKKRLHIEREPEDQDCDYVYMLTKNPDLLQELMGGFQNYRTLAAALIPTYQEKSSYYQDPASIHIRTWENKINVLHLNTAILSDGQRGHSELADITTACSERIRTDLDNGLPTIVIGHHSFHDLHPTVKERLVQLFNQTNVWAYLSGDKHKTNYQGDEFLIYRKSGVEAWPNLVAGKMAATVVDDYSDFGCILYCWDEYSTVTTTQLCWKSNNSGRGLTQLKGEAERTFPMQSDMNSQLYYRLLDCLVESRDQHPSFQLMKVSKELFPKVYLNLGEYMAQGNNSSSNAHLLSDFFQESWNSKEQNHLMFEGEGGIGKTVALLSLATQENFLPNHVPAVYIPLHALKVRDTDDCIGRYLLEEILCGNSVQYGELLSIANKKWDCGPSLILLLDGFNEIPVKARYAVARNIEEWSNKSGVQVITASRFDIRSYLPGLSGKFQPLKLQPLSRTQIQKYLEQNNVSLPASNSILWTVINYPLMLSLYMQTEFLQIQSGSILLDWKDAVSAGAVLWNYLQCELWRCQRYTKNSADPIKYVIAIEYIAPYIAWEMVKKEQFFILEEEFFAYIQNKLEVFQLADRNTWPPHIRKVVRLSGGIDNLPDADCFFELLIHEISLFRMRKTAKNSVVCFMHQRFRDFLAAVHLINLIRTIQPKNVLPEEWRNSIDYYVLNFVAELILQEDAELLWETNRVMRPTSVQATRTMLELQKRLKDYDFTKLNFSDMDLRKLPLYDFVKPGNVKLLLPDKASLLNQTKLSEETFEPTLKRGSALVISGDSRFCICQSGEKAIYILDMNTGQCLHIIGTPAVYSTMSLNVSSENDYCIGASINWIYVWDINTGQRLQILEGSCNAFTVVFGSCLIKASYSNILVFDLSTNKYQYLYTLKGHRGYVHAMAVTMDGHYCVSASADTTLRIWDLDSARCLHILEGHTEPVRFVAVTANGSYCVSASDDGTIRMWEMKTGQCIHILEQGSPIKLLAVTADGNWCVSTSEKMVYIWDMDSGQCIHVLEHREYIRAMTVTTDGSRCVSASGHIVYIWDIESGQCIQKLEHTDFVTAVAVTTDGSRCVSRLYSGSVYIWDMDLGKCLHATEGVNPARYISSLSNKHILTVSRECILNIWDMDTSQCLHIIGEPGKRISEVKIMKDAAHYLIAFNDGTLRKQDIESRQCLCTVKQSKGYIEEIILTADGRRFVSKSNDNLIYIRDADTLECLHVLKGHRTDIKKIQLAKDESCIISIGDRVMRIWDIDTGICLHTIKSPKKVIDFVDIPQHGNHFAGLLKDGTICIWDMDTGTCIHPLMVNDLKKIAITPDGCRLIGIRFFGEMYIWDTVTGQCLNAFYCDGGGMAKIAFTADSSRCACVNHSRKLSIVDINEGQILHEMKGHEFWVNKVKFIKNGNYCISGGSDNSIRIWDVNAGRCLKTIRLNESVGQFHITEDESRCIHLTNDGTIYVWDVPSGQCLGKLITLEGINLYGVDLSKATISPDEFTEVLRQNGAVIESSIN